MLNKKRLKAAALKYKKENLDVPVIASLGTGDFAVKIINEAVKNGIKIVQDKDFFKFEDLFIPGKEIPNEVYKIVIQILTSVLNTNKEGF
jgi:type III secretion system FlhB-like substrate exporter